MTEGEGRLGAPGVTGPKSLGDNERGRGLGYSGVGGTGENFGSSHWELRGSPPVPQRQHRLRPPPGCPRGLELSQGVTTQPVLPFFWPGPNGPFGFLLTSRVPMPWPWSRGVFGFLATFWDTEQGCGAPQPRHLHRSTHCGNKQLPQ